MTTLHVRCADCGQPVIEEDGYLRCPNAWRPWGACGMTRTTVEAFYGPQYAAAVRGARDARIDRAYTYWTIDRDDPVTPDERRFGIPPLWAIARFGVQRP